MEWCAVWRALLKNITCPSCKKTIELQGIVNPIHAGFNNTAVLYCDKCTSTLIIQVYDKKYNILVNKLPWLLDQKEKFLIENNLKPCSCGGSYKFDEPPRCPYCRNSMQSLLQDKIHYFILGNRIDSDKMDIWKT
jgi:uncharacterized protein YbaR (Trm112 family)